MWQPTGQPNAKPEAINAFMLPAGASSEIIKFKPYPFNYLFLLQPKFDDSGMKKYFISITIFLSMVITISTGQTISQQNGHHFFHFYQTGP